MEPSGARRLRELETENAKLKRIVADQVFPAPAEQNPVYEFKTNLLQGQ